MAGDLLDTGIVVDALRGDVRAKLFIDQVSQPGPCCPDVVFAELIQGCRDRSELRRMSAVVIDQLGLIVHDAADARTVIELLEAYRLAHGVGYLDCLIAAMAIHRNACLHTPNGKHFRMIPGLMVRRPYSPRISLR